MAITYQVIGKNPAALFSLKVHRGDGMALLGMDWKQGEPPNDFVGFAIEYQEPGGDRFYALKNRLSFPGPGGHIQKDKLSTRLSPIQKFRWIHFPRNADLEGKFAYRVTPVFMNSLDELSYGEFQEVQLELARETYPGKLNLAYTRGFVSSQAFVDRFGGDDGLKTLMPPKADDGLTFVPTHPNRDAAYDWMGFEARKVIIELLDAAIADQAQVHVIAYDLNEPEMVSRLEQLESRLKIIIDDSDPHGEAHSGETQAQARLVQSAGPQNVLRQHMGNLQHNKVIVVNGPNIKKVICGSTNFSWRGFFIQANAAVVLTGATSVDVFTRAFDDFWNNSNEVADYGRTDSAKWISLGLTGVNASVCFPPLSAKRSILGSIGEDIRAAQSSVFYSLAFLSQTQGPVREAVTEVTHDENIFVYGISDKRTGGFDLLKPDGNQAPLRAEALSKEVPEPFKSEPTGGMGTRIHHKFVVIDFDKPTARCYVGSYNFSNSADRKNGENLVLIKNRRIAVSMMVEALRLFDHYHFRVARKEAAAKHRRLLLQKPPRQPGEEPWWKDDWTKPHKIRDRKLFS